MKNCVKKLRERVGWKNWVKGLGEKMLWRIVWKKVVGKIRF